MKYKQQLQAEFYANLPTNIDAKVADDILAFFLTRFPLIVEELVGEEERTPILMDFPTFATYIKGRNALRQEIINRLNEWGKE